MKKVLMCLAFIGMGVTLENFAMQQQANATPSVPVIVHLLTDREAEELAIQNMDQVLKEINNFSHSNTPIITARMNFLVQHFTQWSSLFNSSTINKFQGLAIVYGLYMQNPPQPNVPQTPNPNLAGLNKRLF